MHYQLHNVRNVNGKPLVELIDEGVIPPQGSWSGYHRWLQSRIDELRQNNAYQQIAVWMTKPASEGAFVAIEAPADNQQGKLLMFVKDS
jgi:hypothetical protein